MVPYVTVTDVQLAIDSLPDVSGPSKASLPSAAHTAPNLMVEGSDDESATDGSSALGLSSPISLEVNEELDWDPKVADAGIRNDGTPEETEETEYDPSIVHIEEMDGQDILWVQTNGGYEVFGEEDVAGLSKPCGKASGTKDLHKRPASPSLDMPGVSQRCEYLHTSCQSNQAANLGSLTARRKRPKVSHAYLEHLNNTKDVSPSSPRTPEQMRSHHASMFSGYPLPNKKPLTPIEDTHEDTRDLTDLPVLKASSALMALSSSASQPAHASSLCSTGGRSRNSTPQLPPYATDRISESSLHSLEPVPSRSSSRISPLCSTFSSPPRLGNATHSSCPQLRPHTQPTIHKSGSCSHSPKPLYSRTPSPSPTSSIPQQLESPTQDTITIDKPVDNHDGGSPIVGQLDGLSERHVADASESLDPAGDINSALRSLGDCEWLTDPAISLLFEAGCPPEARLIHSTYVTLHEPKAMFSKRRLRLRNQRIWFVPLNHYNKHWTLAILDLDKATVDHYDSLSTGVYSPIEALENFVKSLSAGEGNGKIKTFQEWRFRGMHCPVQPNGYDCGVFAMVFAYHRMLGLDLPVKIDHRLWRKVLRRSLDDAVDFPDPISSLDDPNSKECTDMGSPPLRKRQRNDQALGPLGTSVLQDAARDEERWLDQVNDTLRFRRQQSRAAKLGVQLTQETLAVLAALASQQLTIRSQAELEHSSWQKRLQEHKSFLEKYCNLDHTELSVTKSLESAIYNQQQECQRSHRMIEKHDPLVTRWERAKVFCESELARRIELESTTSDTLKESACIIQAHCEKMEQMYKQFRESQIAFADSNSS